MVGEKGVVPVPPPHGLDRCMGLACGLFVQVGGCEVLFFLVVVFPGSFWYFPPTTPCGRVVEIQTSCVLKKEREFVALSWREAGWRVFME